MASGPITSWEMMGKQWKQWLTLFFGAPKSLQMLTAAMKLKESEMQYLDAISKTTEWSLFISKANHSITVIQNYAPTSNAEEAEVEQFYEDLQDLLELTPQKRCPFHYRGLECKSRKSINTWSNRQIWPWVQNEAGQRLIFLSREYTGNSKCPFPATQETILKKEITR